MCVAGLPWNGLASVPHRSWSRRLLRSDRQSATFDPAHLVCQQDEQKQQHRQPDPHTQSPRGIPGLSLVAHHEEQGRTQTCNDAQERHANDDLHLLKYRMRLRDQIPALAALAVIVLTALLGRWQLQRAEEKAMAASQREAAVSRAPVALNSGPGAETLDGQLLEVQGTWQPDHTIFLDNRTRKGVAGFHVLTPLRLGTVGGTSADAQAAVHVLVLRGWVARDVVDRTRLPPVATPADPIRLEGLGMRALAQPMRLAKGADVDPGAPRIWQHLELEHYAQWYGLTMHPLMVRQLSDTGDGLMRDWVLPGSGEDKHRAYAFQWFAMSTVTALAWAGLAWRRRQRTRL